MYTNLHATNQWNRPDLPISPTISYVNDGITHLSPCTCQKNHNGSQNLKLDISDENRVTNGGSTFT
jgi:hypothetical protein